MRYFTPVLTGFLFTLCLLVSACAKRSTEQLQLNMRDAYSAVSDLYRYVWNIESFQAKENEGEILALLDRLSGDFHKIDKQAPTSVKDPEFTVTLTANRELLKDIHARFSDGSKDYALWRLRGLVGNCIACHTRYQVPVDFVGETPKVITGTPEEKFAIGEFLVATRQFDVATEHLLNLASERSLSLGGSHDAIEALKLWLVVQVRVKDDFKGSDAALGEFLKRSTLSPAGQRMVQGWRKALTRLGKTNSAPGSLEQIRELLKPIARSPEFYEDDLDLPQTLRASSLLHAFITRKDVSKDEKREATYLLGLAYSHTNTRFLEPLRDLYLEQCIREFPNSREARECFEMLKDELEFQSSGSGGVHMTERDKTRLANLQRIAF